MRKPVRIGLALAGILVVAVLVIVGAGYQAAHHVPGFYQEAIDRQPEQQQQLRDAFIAEVTGLASDLHTHDAWQRLLTAEQINAYLALEMPRDYPGVADGPLRDPRVSIGDREATVACRWESGPIPLVLSLSVDAYLAEPNVIAVRIRRARAGALPVPLGGVLDAISRAAGELKLRLEWRKSHGDPVALISLGRPNDSSATPSGLHSIELHAGALLISGGSRPTVAQSDNDGKEQPDDASPESSDGHPSLGAAPNRTRQE
jgi:hypothetical protein